MGENYITVRKELVERLSSELVGPNYPRESIKGKPLQKYLCGILWPINSGLAMEENEQGSTQGKETHKEEYESLAPLSKAMNPSTVGLSFLVDSNISNIYVTVRFGMYENVGEKEEWTRIPYEDMKQEKINISASINKRQKKCVPNNDSVFLEWITRPYGDALAVSMFLVNRNYQAVDEYDIDHKCVFQPEIVVEGKGSYPFVVRQNMHRKAECIENDNVDQDTWYEDSDTRSNNLLFRDEVVFGLGHSISVHWDLVSRDGKKADKLFTRVIPTYEIPMVIPPDWNKGGTLDMKQLAQMKTGEEVYQALKPLYVEYGKWIEERKDEIPFLPEEHGKTAKKHMMACSDSLRRIKNGLELIRSKNNSRVFEAFIFANQVMALQRSHTEAARTGKNPDDISAVWRPFQMAFLLQNLEGLIHPNSDDRKMADLLWFPTGGGKTEAYLGLAAFTLGYRRMKGSGDLRTDTGVSIIMRYTLRLLTIQQFQRAAAMICACEHIRREKPSLLGGTPFRIGLWVGEKSVPNKFGDAKNMIEALRSIALGKRDTSIDLSKGSPVQLVSCPWCNHALVDEKDKALFLKTYKVKGKERRIKIYCPNKKCDFHAQNSKEGLPVLVTDEEIYRLLPDMLIGTVDKFARMPWKPEVQNLFGKVKGEVPGWGFVSNGNSTEEMSNIKSVATNNTIQDSRRVHPPDLIIQDELHLISGPLGTMVGLYETAVDYLSSLSIEGRKVGPKIVASTATIRNADRQIQGLFTRKAKIFPSPGLSHKDSFFAKQRPLDETPGRLYVGVFAPGRSMKTALLRVYANQLASTSVIEETSSSKYVDPYQTLVGYFNSLRELGGAVRLIEDDIPSRMKALEKQNAQEQKYAFKQREYERDVPELTSRIDSADIPKILKNLEQPFYKEGPNKPVNVLLASNMISVGVDVARLGLMVVNGQPKTTAEYIQSTSRIGRTFPGLVIMTYNWIRPRDISHYEEFYAYHSAIYRYVEPISVTPFSSRARDRGLAGVMVSMARLGHSSMTANKGAMSLQEDDSIVEEIQAYLLKRVRDMNAPRDEVLEDINKRFNEWEEIVQKSQVVYSYSKKETINNLLYPLGQRQKGVFKTPGSMRDVEVSAGIYLRRD